MDELLLGHVPDTVGTQKPACTVRALTVPLGLVLLEKSKGLWRLCGLGQRSDLASCVSYRIAYSSTIPKREYQLKPVNAASSSDLNGVSSSTSSKISGKFAIRKCASGVSS